MTQHQRLTVHLARIGLISGIGTGVALLVYMRTGFAALLGDAGFYLLLAGAGWFTGQAIAPLLGIDPERRRQILCVAFALGYAAGVAPLDTLLVEVSLTGDWLVPSLWLAAVSAMLAGALAWSVGQRDERLSASAAIGVAAMAAIVTAVNLLIWFSAGWSAPFDSLLFAGVWLIYFVPAIWLPVVTYFSLQPPLTFPLSRK